jgi:hypothetical protein
MPAIPAHIFKALTHYSMQRFPEGIAEFYATISIIHEVSGVFRVLPTQLIRLRFLGGL